MARLVDRNPRSAPGDWYVDTECIDCDIARHYAPEVIEADDDGLSVFIRQPETDAERSAVWRATLACPTRSIGSESRQKAPDGVFPWALDDGVYLCGHNHRSSFGAHSYFIERPDGNLLVDSPRYTRQLVEPFEQRGGISDILLSHRDDVADADKYAERFGANVWIHRDDHSAAPYATHLLDNDAEIRPGVVAYWVPGHTKGSVIYNIDRRLLLTGDSLAWNWRKRDLYAFRRACWYSWDVQKDSLGRLASLVEFEWVLPGHGKWHRAPKAEMHDRLVALVDRM